MPTRPPQTPREVTRAKALELAAQVKGPSLSSSQLEEVKEWQRAHLAREGVSARIERVGEVLRSGFFHRSVRREITAREGRDGPFTSLEPVRQLAMRALDVEFGCDMEGVDLQTKWDPATKVLNYRAVPSLPALQAANQHAMDKLRARRKRERKKARERR